MNGPFVATAEGVWIIAAIALLAGIIGTSIAYTVRDILDRRTRVRIEEPAEHEDWSRP